MVGVGVGVRLGLEKHGTLEAFMNVCAATGMGIDAQSSKSRQLLPQR